MTVIVLDLETTVASVDGNKDNSPFNPKNRIVSAHWRMLDGEEIEFSAGFTGLHTLVYQKTLAGEGFGIDEAKTAIQIVHDIRNTDPTGIQYNSHPILKEHKM